MKKHRRLGFTLVEISLFLAVTGLLFVAIVAGTQNALWQQKYNDSVQNYANFLKSVYAQVSNPQGIGAGRTGKAIYGKLITFGQTKGLDGNNIKKEQEIFVYDVVGNAEIDGTGSVKELFADEKNGISLVVTDNDTLDFAGFYESYTPTWGAVIENIGGSLYEGSILIVRHPRSGVVNTLASGGVLQVNQCFYDGTCKIEEMLRSAMGGFDTAQVDFCLNPYEVGTNKSRRRDIRLVTNARNASGVEVVDLESDDNKCAAE